LNVNLKQKKKEGIMEAAIMKVGTFSSLSYWLRGRKKLSDYRIGDRITFKPQLEKGAKWEFGIITGWSWGMPLVDRF